MDAPTPDRAFMAEMKRMDKNLGIKFNGKHFVITYAIPDGRTVNIWRVVAGDGGFRQPDHRDIEMLKQADIERESAEEKQKRVERYMAAVREADRKRARENIRDWTKDGKIQLHSAFARCGDGGKHNSAFRRIPIIGHGN